MKKEEIFTIPYTPYHYQKKFHEALETHRFAILNWSRRIGKTTACVVELCTRAITRPGTQYAYVCPFATQTRKITWPLFQQYFGNYPGIVMNKQEMSVTFTNSIKDGHASVIYLYGAENEGVRGSGFDGIILDEYSDMRYDFWTDVMLPTIVDRNGFAIVISTPKGHNDFHRLYTEAEKNDDWYVDTTNIYDAGIFSKETIDMLQRNAKSGFNQEFLVSFEGTVAGAIYQDEITLMEKEKRIGFFPYDAKRVVHTVWDVGWNDATAILFVQKVNNRYVIIDHLEAGKSTYLTLFTTVLNKPYRFGKHFLPWDAIKYTQTSELNAKDIAEGLGMEIDFIAKDAGGVYGVANGIKLCRSFLENLYINEVKCPIWIDYMKRYHWKRNRDGTSTNKPDHDISSNTADATRYLSSVADKLYEFGDSQMKTYEQPEFESIDPFFNTQ